jgi:hypothetical protein
VRRLLPAITNTLSAARRASDTYTVILHDAPPPPPPLAACIQEGSLPCAAAGAYHVMRVWHAMAPPATNWGLARGAPALSLCLTLSRSLALSLPLSLSLSISISPGPCRRLLTQESVRAPLSRSPPPLPRRYRRVSLPLLAPPRPAGRAPTTRAASGGPGPGSGAPWGGTGASPPAWTPAPSPANSSTAKIDPLPPGVRRRGCLGWIWGRSRGRTEGASG